MFKYKIEEGLGTEELNELGAKGWKLVSVVFEVHEDVRDGGWFSYNRFYFIKTYDNV